MLINLSYNPEDLGNFLLKNPSIGNSLPLLDVTGVCQGNYPNCTVARLLKGAHQTERKALTDLVDTIGELSRVSSMHRALRSYQVNNLPVFWLTGLAQKHDYYHWGQAVFFLKHLLVDFPDLFASDSKKIIIVPNGAGHCANVIRALFLPRDKVLISERESPPSLLTILMNLGKFIFNISKYSMKPWRMEKKGIKDPTIIFVGSLNNKTTSRAFTLANSVSRAAVIPENVYHLSSLAKVAGDLPASFFRCKPTISQLYLLCQSIFITARNVQKLVPVDADPLITILAKAVRSEMLDVLKYPSFFLAHQWMQNYFKTLTGNIKVLYEDELYVFGRVVSSAAKLANNHSMTTYGMQHGLISENHTVYRLTAPELTDMRQGDALPIPDYFIVWGEVFKNRMLLDNSLIAKRIFVLGSLSHQIVPQIDHTAVIHSVRFLWCTTVFEYAKLEYEIIKKGIQRLPLWNMTIRLHPLAHISEAKMMKILDPEMRAKVQFNNRIELGTQILQHDVVIASGQSTIFLDAYMAGKTAFRMDLGLCFIDDLDLKEPSLKNIRTSDDFEFALSKIDRFYQFESKTSTIFNMDEEGWLSLLRTHNS